MKNNVIKFPQPNILGQQYLTVTEAATLLSISKDEMKQLVELKHLKKYGDNGYRYLLYTKDIVKLIDRTGNND